MSVCGLLCIVIIATSSTNDTSANGCEPWVVVVMWKRTSASISLLLSSFSNSQFIRLNVMSASGSPGLVPLVVWYNMLEWSIVYQVFWNVSAVIACKCGLICCCCSIGACCVILCTSAACCCCGMPSVATSCCTAVSVHGILSSVSRMAT